MLRPGTLALTILLSMLAALGPLSTDMYLASLPDIGRGLGAPIAQVQLTLSSYLIGFAIGQILYGPVSDLYGRRPSLLAALALFTAASFVCTIAQSIDILIAARFIQAIGGAGAIVLARAMVRDLYSGARAGRELSLMGTIMGVAPIVAPMVGGVLQTAFGWRANFVLLGGLAVIAITAVARLLPETRPRRGEPISLAAMARGYAAVASHRGFLAYLGIITATYGGLFAWVAGASIVLQGVYGLSPFAFGLLFPLGGAGYVIGTVIAARRVIRLGLDRMIGVGVLLVACGGLAAAAVVAANMHAAIWLVLAMALYLAGVGLSMPQSMAGALTPFPDRAGTASALMGFTQQSVAAIVAAATGGYLGSSAWPVAGVVAVMGCLAFVLWAVTRGVRAQDAGP
jgi:DHA1 family bicyclomycin/chloramphenicol resistance-like MFS transporter